MVLEFHYQAALTGKPRRRGLDGIRCSAGAYLSAASRPGELKGSPTKREALHHTKMKRLCRRLDIPHYQAVGILEALWHLTAKQAHRGDIGRLSNEEIAIGIDYRDDEDALIRELVFCGWLDADPKHRLVVHDWHDHAPDSVHVKIARAQEFFVSGKPPKTQRLGKYEREKADSFYTVVRTNEDSVRTNSASVRTEGPSVHPSCARNPDPCTPPPPPPPPPPKENTLFPEIAGNGNGHRKPAGPVTLPTVAGEIFARHPKRRRDCSAHQVEKKLAAILKHKRISASGADAYLEQINRNHAAACSSSGWQKDDGEFAKSLENWLAPTKERYEVEGEVRPSGPPRHAII